jgi:chromosome segregation ATPase
MQQTQTQNENQIEQVVNRLNNLENRIKTLESENESLRDENKKMRKAVSSLEEKNKKLKENVSQTKEDISDLKEEATVTESRLDGLCDGLTDAEDEIKNTYRKGEENYADLAGRLSTIEESLDLNVIDISTSNTASADAVIEQFAQLPQEVKQDQLKDSMRRATKVFEKFVDWSSYTRNGYVVRSSELKKLLSTEFDTEFEWSQVYRVMDAFENGTPPEYEQKQLDKQGRVLIQHHDNTKARANTVVGGD